MVDEHEFQARKRELQETAAELGLRLSDAQVETRLRRVQARAQEHDVSMAEIQRDDLRRMLWGHDVSRQRGD
jgi:hypothetical protein